MTKISNRKSLSRRSFVKGGLLAGSALVAAPYIHTSAKAADPLVLISWGGSYRKAWEEAFLVPFTAETGIEVVVADTPDMAKLKAQVTSGNVEWDVYDCPGAQAMSGIKNGFWEELDTNQISLSGLNVPTNPYAMPYYTYPGVIGWDPKKHPEGKRPLTFADLFNAEKFPGSRGLRTRISETLDIALLGDGVDPAKLYPLDVDRGFAVLERIKPHVKKWIEATPETITLVQRGEIDFSYTYTGRVKQAQADGISIDCSLAQTINAANYAAVPKGSTRKDNAMKLLAFTQRPDRAAAFSELMVYLPTVEAAIPLLSDKAKRWMPDLSDPQNVVMNDAWWGDNYDELQKRFSEWLLTS